MVGHTRDEQRLLTVVAGLLGEVSDAQAVEAAEVLAPDPQRYREAFPDPEELYEVVRSDWLFRMPSLHLAEAQLAGGRPRTPLRAGLAGAGHGGPVRRLPRPGRAAGVRQPGRSASRRC